MTDTEFHFVVARPWSEYGSEDLAIYSYHGEIQKGPLKHAQNLLEYVQRMKPNKDYSIYKVNFEKVSPP